jgi:CubicO group peptidase (beta-lactamase class C family)
MDVEELVRDAVPDQDGPGCAVGLVRAGQPLVTACRGLANLEHRVPITERTVFHVASVSKQFTAYAVALLAADGRLRLDDPVARHLDWFGFPEITVDQLIRHTSGLRDQWELLEAAGRRLEDVITTEDLVRLVTAQRGLNFPPGTAQRYSNTGYTLLGLIVAATSGLSLREFCARRIFEPLGMSSTRFVDDCHEVVPDRADSYGGEAGRYRRIVLSYSTAGATSLNTTVADLARWASHEPAMRALREGPVRDYGLGVWVDATLGTVRHSGADAGFRSHLVVLPDSGSAAIVLANNASIEPERLCDMLIGDLFPRPGLFYSDELDAHVRLVHDGGELSLVWPTREAPLHRIHDGSYVASLLTTAECPQATVRFSPDHSEFRYSTPGAEGILFHRREVECSNSESSR